MFSQVMKFVNTNQPKIVLLENLSALLTHDKGNSFATIVGALESNGYTVVHRILKCSDYGIPQMRKRLFIVGFKNVDVDDVSMFFELAEFEHRTTLKSIWVRISRKIPRTRFVAEVSTLLSVTGTTGTGTWSMTKNTDSR